MKKNTIIVIVIIGLIVLLTGIFLPRRDDKEVPNDKNTYKWNTIYDDNFNIIDINEYSNQLSKSDYFYDDSGSNEYLFAIPTNVSLELKNIYETVYSNSDLRIYYNIEKNSDFNEIISSLYVDYQIMGYQSTILKNETLSNDTKTVILCKLYDSENEKYNERLLIYYLKGNNEYYVLHYEINNYIFSNSFILDAFNNFKKNANGINRTNCSIIDNKYSCDYGDKKIVFDFNNEKYINYPFYISNNYGSYFITKTNGDDDITIMLYYHRDNIEEFISENYIKDNDYKEVIINDTKLLQYYEKDSNLLHNIIYRGNYALIIVISSSNGNNILNDFINFEIK